MFRETAINTGTDTKIMRDSSVTADLEDVPRKFSLNSFFFLLKILSFRFKR